ncbi:MAG: DUF58 domain-containing protein [Bdellovibrio bacteriovorus]
MGTPRGTERRRPSGRAGRWLQGLFRRAPIGADGLARIGARQVYILPTRTGLFYGFVVLLMLLGSLNYQNNLGLLFTFFLAAVALVAMHHCWLNLLGLALQVRPGPPVFAGDAARFELIVRNERSSRRYDLWARNGLNPAGPLTLAARDQKPLGLLKPSERRGPLHLTEVRVETRHPMGLFRAWSHVRCQATILVYPRPAPEAPSPPAGGGDQAQRLAAAAGEGADDFLGPREYRLGDSPRHLDWKALARERGLVVKQFGGDQGQDVWIDWDRLRAPDPERRLSLLTRQVLDAAEARLRFGLRLPGRLVPLGRGEAQAQRCLTELALYEHSQAPSRLHQRAA